MHDAIICIKDVMFTLVHLFPVWKAAGESEPPKDSIKVELLVPILLPNAVQQFLRSANHQKPKEMHPLKLPRLQMTTDTAATDTAANVQKTFNKKTMFHQKFDSP